MANNHVLSGRMIFEKGNSAWISTNSVRQQIATSWGIDLSLVVFYSDRLFLIPGFPYVRWEVFDSNDRVFVEWLIYDLKSRGGHGEKISDVLGVVRKAIEAKSVVHDDDVIPI